MNVGLTAGTRLIKLLTVIARFKGSIGPFISTMEWEELNGGAIGKGLSSYRRRLSASQAPRR